MNALLEAALGYAAKGWPVFPCRASDSAERDNDGVPLYAAKSPLVKGGLKAASCDAGQIRTWWARWPDALIGLPLGGATGVFALDFDPREEVDPDTGELTEFTLAQLKADTEALIGCELPSTVGQRTPSGGVHIFFRQPAEGPPIRNRGCLPLHVDVRGEGGYVIVAPSIVLASHKGKTGPYRWLRADLDHVPADAPQALIDVLRAPKGSRVLDGKVVPPERGRAGVKRDLTTADASELVEDAVRKYALAALEAEIRALAAARQGNRNNQINASAFALGQLVGAGALSASVARASLQDVVAAWPDAAKSEKTIESGLAAGIAQPRDLSEVQEAAARRAERKGSGARLRDDPGPPDPGAPPPPGGDGRQPFQSEGSGPQPPSQGAGGEEDTDLRAAFLPHTDLGNAERWVLRHGDRFRWVPEWGWLAWDGRRWNKPEAETMLQQSIFATVRAIQDEADAVRETGLGETLALTDSQLGAIERAEHSFADDGRDRLIEVKAGKARFFSDKIASWGRASESSGRIRAIETLVKPKVSAHPTDFDADPMVLNVLNGTLVFERSAGDGCGDPVITLRPHAQADLITKLAPVEYDPAARCPQFDAFLEEVQPDAEIRRFLDAWAGYGLTGDTAEQVFVINHGLGANGKSVWSDVIGWIAGDYSTTVPIETFLDQGAARRGSDATPDLAELPGRRFVRTSEPRRGRSFAEELIKLITGQEPMKVRHLNRDFFEFQPVMKITVSANQRPEASSDAAFWRRVILVPWEVIIPAERRDKNLAIRLREEAPGILNRLLTGAEDWMARGLPIADKIREATDAYRDDRDPLGRFLGMATEPEAEGKIQSSKLYEVYQAWAKFASEAEWTQKGFSGAMSDRGFRKKTSNGVWWLGLRLTRDVGDFIDTVTGKPLQQGADWVSDGDTEGSPEGLWKG